MGSETPIAQAVAREFRAGLARKRMTHAELARAGGLSRKMVDRVLRGNGSITLDEYVLLLDALGGETELVVHGLVGEIHKRSRGNGGGASRSAAASA